MGNDKGKELEAAQALLEKIHALKAELCVLSEKVDQCLEKKHLIVTPKKIRTNGRDNIYSSDCFNGRRRLGVVYRKPDKAPSVRTRPAAPRDEEQD